MGIATNIAIAVIGAAFVIIASVPLETAISNISSYATWVGLHRYADSIPLYADAIVLWSGILILALWANSWILKLSAEKPSIQLPSNFERAAGVQDSIAVNKIEDDELVIEAITGTGTWQLYLCGSVKAPSNKDIVGCTARIVRLTEWDENKRQFIELYKLGHPLRCIWANYHPYTSILNVQAGIQERFNLVLFDGSNLVGPRLFCEGLPNRLTSALVDPGTYRLEITVSGSGQSAQSTIEFSWGPMWDDVSGRVVSSEPH